MWELVALPRPPPGRVTQNITVNGGGDLGWRWAPPKQRDDVVAEEGLGTHVTPMVWRDKTQPSWTCAFLNPRADSLAGQATPGSGTRKAISP